MHPIADLYNWEGQLESGFLAVLSAGLTYAPVPSIYIAQSLTVARTPRIEFRCTNFSRASTHVGPSNNLDHATFEGEADVITDRTITSPSQNHGQLRGMVRYLFSKEAQRFISPTITYWLMLDLEETSATMDVESDDREDRTILKYRGVIGMLPAAYPGTLP